MARQIFGKGRFKKGSISEVADHLIKKTADHVRTKCFDIFADTIRATPIDTGQLRNNWNTSVGQPNLSFSEGRGSSKLPQAKSVTESYELGEDIFFANAAPYAMAVEFGGYVQTPNSTKIRADGFLKQAPSGMLRISIRNHV